MTNETPPPPTLGDIIDGLTLALVVLGDVRTCDECPCSEAEKKQAANSVRRAIRFAVEHRGELWRPALDDSVNRAIAAHRNMTRGRVMSMEEIAREFPNEP